MSDSRSTAFFSGQGIAVEVPEIEAKLTELWGPATEREGGPDVENPALTRVVLANLVVATCAKESGQLDQVLPTVEARYPCRAIVLCRTDDSERRVKAEVSAICHLPAPGLPQVCSERIILRAGPEASDLLPGAVRTLLEADLPFVLWWADDPRCNEAMYRDFADEASRILIDLPDPASEPAALRVGLDPSLNPYSRDIAWFGITRWRELIAQFFDPAGSEESLKRITSVRIEAEADAAERPPRVAAWLAGWLAGQLGWKPKDRRILSGGALEARFNGPAGDIALTIQTAVDPSFRLARIKGVSISTTAPGKGGTFRVTRVRDAALDATVEVDASPHGILPRTVQINDFDAPRRVAAALESARDDPPFRRALPPALWLLGDGYRA
jgi:glucose-6-phosphate dehydrogenase assembly protein OpcA